MLCHARNTLHYSEPPVNGHVHAPLAMVHHCGCGGGGGGGGDSVVI